MSLFDNDLFEIRRANQVGAGNPYDPESLMSGREAELGFTYSNSHREWDCEEDYNRAVKGLMSTEEVLEKHPRVFNEGALGIVVMLQ